MALKEWMAKYGIPVNSVPECAGTRSGKLIVCADADCIWQDLEELGCKRTNGRGSVEHDEAEFMMVNKIGEVFPGRIAHWYSNQPHHLQAFVKARRNEYSGEFGPVGMTHAANTGPCDYVWPWQCFGTSGLGAILTGLGLGYTEIILCGMPLENTPHNGEPPWRRTRFRNEVSTTLSGDVEASWRNAIDIAFDGRVKSMSGRTREWLGSPS